MADITFSPVPGTYVTRQTVHPTVDPSVNSIMFTTDGTAPTLAKYIAYDSLSPPNPFIATVQDGKGNALFDGGFPKWYNGTVSGVTWTTFAEMNAACKYLANAIGFIENKTKVAAGNKKVLFLGDAEPGESYNIKDAAGTSFRTTFNLVCSIMGYTPTYKTRSDYGGTLDPTYAELDQYCCVVLMSSVYATTQLITNNAVSNIIAYRDAGNGMFLITDHGVDIDGFYKTANYIAVNLGASFTGYYDRTPMQVGFLRTTYGDHPLYANLLDTEYIPAGASESKVVLTTQTSYTPASLPDFDTTTQGISTVRFLLMKSDGTLSTTSVTYAINIVEPVRFTSGGNTITSVTPTFSHTFNLTFALDSTSFGAGTNISGLMKVGGVTIGTFAGTTSTPTYSFYSGGNTLTITSTTTIELEVQQPVQFFKTLSVPIQKIPGRTLSMAKLTAALNAYDLAATPRLVIKQATSKLGLTRKISAAKQVKTITDYTI